MKEILNLEKKFFYYNKLEWSGQAIFSGQFYLSKILNRMFRFRSLFICQGILTKR